MKWLNESYNRSKKLKDTYKLHDIEIFIKDQLPDHINPDFVFKYIRQRVPGYLLKGVDMIYIGQFDKIIDKMYLKYKKNKNKIKLITIGAGDVNKIGYRLKNIIKESKERARWYK